MMLIIVPVPDPLGKFITSPELRERVKFGFPLYTWDMKDGAHTLTLNSNLLEPVFKILNKGWLTISWRKPALSS